MTEPTFEVTVEWDLDMGYIRLSQEPIHRTVELTDEVNVDMDVYGMVVGVEVLSLDATIPFTRMKEELHVHSDVIDLLQRIQPSVAASVRITQGADGTAHRAHRATEVSAA